MTQTTVLGLGDSHDAGAALVRDGCLIGAVNEERLTRKKQISGLPKESLKSILEFSGVNPTGIDLVVLAGNIWIGHPPPHNDFSLADGSFSNAQKLVEFADSFTAIREIIRRPSSVRFFCGVMPKFARSRLKQLSSHLKSLGISAPVTTCDHHDAHLASAYYTSGWPSCLVISNDGFGDGLCSKVAIGRDGRLTNLSSNTAFNSVGNLYNLVTHVCGFRGTHEVGKIAGLAAHGDPGRTIGLFRRMIRWDQDRGRYINEGPMFRQALELIRREVAGISREDIAAGIQRHLEEILARMAKFYLAKYDLSRIALVGGVHANVRANQAIAELPGVEEIYVYPHLGDGGLAAGAAFLGTTGLSGEALDPVRLSNIYLGPAFDDEAIERELRHAGLAYERPDDVAKVVASHLAAGCVVGRFDGAMEYGPRALGNRSILYAATDPEVNAWLNAQLNRTEFMPFAPVLRIEDAPKYLINYSEATEFAATFMTRTFMVSDLCRQEAPAVVHVDGTARPQILRSDFNPGVYAILSAYNRLTGLSVLVNTSFNRHEEPIVCKPEEAIQAFLEARLDILAIGPFVVDNPATQGQRTVRRANT